MIHGLKIDAITTKLNNLGGIENNIAGRTKIQFRRSSYCISPFGKGISRYVFTDVRRILTKLESFGLKTKKYKWLSYAKVTSLVHSVEI